MVLVLVLVLMLVLQWTRMMCLLHPHRRSHGMMTLVAAR